MRFLVLQHVAVEHPALFRDCMREEAIAWDTIELDEGESLPALDGYDARSSRGPWTQQFLAMIGEQPHVRAPDLAESIGWETKPFKEHVRKLKGLGLTISHSPGYELSPRGRSVLDALD